MVKPMRRPPCSERHPISSCRLLLLRCSRLFKSAATLEGHGSGAVFNLRRLKSAPREPSLFLLGTCQQLWRKNSITLSAVLPPYLYSRPDLFLCLHAPPRSIVEEALEHITARSGMKVGRQCRQAASHSQAPF